MKLGIGPRCAGVTSSKIPSSLLSFPLVTQRPVDWFNQKHLSSVSELEYYFTRSKFVTFPSRATTSLVTII
ncbi:hypothetical protein RSAG8_11489, partial [Rhizoctonia solani AG-8 WAC10335]